MNEAREEMCCYNLMLRKYTYDLQHLFMGVIKSQSNTPLLLSQKTHSAFKTN